MGKIIKLLALILLFLSLAELAKADIAPPTSQTTFYFQKSGQPITQPIKYSIECYGTAYLAADKLLKISEASEICPEYGCKSNSSNFFEAYRKTTQYCNLKAEINSEKFTVNNFLGDKLEKLSCASAGFTMATNDKYYKDTPEYYTCIDTVIKDYYPQGNGKIKGDFLCDKVQPDEFQNCITALDQKRLACEKYLEDVTSKLVMTKNGYPYEKICEAKVELLANNPTPQYERFSNRLVTSLKCAILRLFKKTCYS